MSSPEYVRVPCPECEASVKVETDLLGEWVTCPKCSQDFVAKDQSARAKPRPARRDDRDDEDDDRDRRRSSPRRARDEDEDDDRRGPRPETCPNCGSRRSAKVRYTWWGGLVGPAVFGLVKCQKCSRQYVHATGKPLGAVHIIVYSLVILAICGGIVLALAVVAG